MRQVLFAQLRSELDKLLLQKIEEPGLELELTGRTLSTIVSILEDEASGAEPSLSQYS